MQPDPPGSNPQEQLAKLRKRARKAKTLVIVGGGPAGLLTAYLLLQRYSGRYLPVVIDGNTCHARVGGNAYTVPVQLGEFARWVDLGVNDYNAATYHNIHQLLRKLGVEGQPLRDTTTWAGSSHGQWISYTDEDLATGRVPCELARDFYRFKAEAYNDAMYGGFFDQSLASYAARKGYSDAFLQCNLYPRVNGMYYVDQSRPAPQMPLGAVMRYYGLQEGFGTGPADRRYFAGGSTHWLETLATAIRAMGGVVASRSQVTGLTASGDRKNPIRVAYQAAWCPWWAGTMDPLPGHVDCSRVVLAVQADVAAGLLAQHPDLAEVQGLLQRIRYTKHEALGGNNQKLTLAVAHTDPRVLPDPGRPSTYNISIHDNYDQPHPYSISYWCNSHQNDQQNPAFRGKEVPNFYVTVNPPPDRQPDPQLVLQTPPPSGTGDAVPAMAHFAHNTECADTWDVQLQLCTRHQGIGLLGGKLYFAGGWGIGAGLHEECWYAADLAVRRIASKRGKKSTKQRCEHLIGPSRQAVDALGSHAHLPPQHLRIAFGRIPEPYDK